MGREPRRVSSTGLREGAKSRARASCKFVSSRLLATIALFAASAVSAHAQTRNWTGLVSSDWFVGANWDTFLFPRQTDDATINTVTPNATVLSDPGALARNLTVGANGTGMLTIQNGGTLADSSGAVGNLPGGLGTVTVTGAGSNWSNAGTVVVGGLGTGTLNIQNGGTVNSGGGSVGLSAGLDGHGDGDRPGLQLDQRSKWRAQYRQFWHRHTHDRKRWDGLQYHQLHRQHRPMAQARRVR